MSRYFMELPSTDKRTCEIAVNWIKKNFPHITKGFTYNFMENPFIDYSCNSLIWYDINNDNFLYWGHRPEADDIIVPFPGYYSIDIGEL